MIATDTSLGNWFSRQARAAAYMLVPTETRRAIEQAIVSLPAHARYLNTQWASLERAADRLGWTHPQVRDAKMQLSKAAAHFEDFAGSVRTAVDKAIADGHRIEVKDNTAATMNAWPIVVLIVTAIVAPIAAAYLVLGAWEAYLRYLNERRVFDAAIAANRWPELFADLSRNDSPTNRAIGSVGNVVALVGLAGVAAWYLSRRRRP